MNTTIRCGGRRVLAVLLAMMFAVAMVIAVPAWARADGYLIVVGGTTDPTGEKSVKRFLTPESLRWHGVTPDKVIRVQYPASIFGSDGAATNLTPSVMVGMENLRAALASVPAGEKVVLAGESQGSIVISQVLTELNALPEAQRKNITAVLAADETRPNGGLLTRLPNMSLLPLWRIDSLQTPKYDGIRTISQTHQYDGFSDLPAVLDPLAVANAVLGIVYRHVPKTQYVDPSDPTNVYPVYWTGTKESPNTSIITRGNQTDVLFYAQHLPILQPIRDLAASTRTQALVVPVLDAIEPVLRAWIEMSYDRANPSSDVRLSLLPRLENVVTLALTLPGVVVQGGRNFADDVQMILQGKAPDSPLRNPVLDPQGMKDWQDGHPPFVIDPFTSKPSATPVSTERAGGQDATVPLTSSPITLPGGSTVSVATSGTSALEPSGTATAGVEPTAAAVTGSSSTGSVTASDATVPGAKASDAIVPDVDASGAKGQGDATTPAASGAGSSADAIDPVELAPAA